MQLKVSYEGLGTLFIIAYYLFALIAQQELTFLIIGSHESLSFYATIVCGFLCSLIWIKRCKGRVTPFFYVYFGLLILATLNSIVIRESGQFGIYFITIVSYAIGSLLTEPRYASPRIFLVPFWVLIIFIFFRIIYNTHYTYSCGHV